MGRPWLSVIIPCRNGQRWLAAALQSIVDQEEQGIEVIFADGSADDISLDIVNTFSDRLNIRAFRRTDLSWMARTNLGVEQARGDLICMLHVDDLWMPNKCVKLREWVSVAPDAVMHVHSCYIIDETGKRLGIWRCPLPSDGTPLPADTFLERLLVQCFIAAPTPVIRRDAYVTVGGLDNSIWMTADWDLYLKITAVGNIFCHSDPLACYRVHKSSLTARLSTDIADYRNQQETVVHRHTVKLSPASRQNISRVAAASIEVNIALAAVYGRKFSQTSGRLRQITKAFVALMTLGPHGIYLYFVYSRIADRVMPRLRALVAGRL